MDANLVITPEVDRVACVKRPRALDQDFSSPNKKKKLLHGASSLESSAQVIITEKTLVLESLAKVGHYVLTPA